MITEAVDFLKVIAGGIVSYPSDVQIVGSTDDLGVLLSVYVNPRDMGRIIGKAGDTINAVRKIVHIYGMNKQANISIKIIEPKI